MATTTQLAVNVNDARRLALFASGLQPSDAPTAETVAQATDRAIRRLGVRGCVARMAQEFGDHPDAAARRMRWAGQLAAWPKASVSGGHDAGIGREAARTAGALRPRGLFSCAATGQVQNTTNSFHAGRQQKGAER